VLGRQPAVNPAGNRGYARVTGVRAGELQTSYPRYVAGERNGPPEDCGGIPGFYAALAARADPDHPDHDEFVEWLDEYDPEVIDELPLKIAIRRIANRRNAARSHLAKKRLISGQR